MADDVFGSGAAIAPARNRRIEASWLDAANDDDAAPHTRYWDELHSLGASAAAAGGGPNGRARGRELRAYRRARERPRARARGLVADGRRRRRPRHSRHATAGRC